jgi:DNA (cytosine-5)-methyltransferase 1
MDLGRSDTTEIIAGSIASDPVFAVIGGPPCQGFSTAGARIADDPRNRLIFNYLSVVHRLQPRWFLFENVEGLLTSGGGAPIVALVKEFVSLGYALRLEKVNFAQYGLPQGRKRVVLIGNRVRLDFAFPEPTHTFNAGKHKSHGNLPQAPTLIEALAGLGPANERSGGRVRYASEAPENAYDELMRGDAPDVSLHTWSASASDKNRYAHLRPGQTMKDLPSHLWHSSFARRANRRVMDGTPTEKRGGSPSGLKRLRGDLNSLTITGAATREFIHPVANRPLTLREAARLQSFPDSYEFEGKGVAIGQQIGNAFPPLCAAIFAKHIMAIDGRAGTGLGCGSEAKAGLLGYKLTEATGMSPALAATDKALKELAEPELPIISAAA